MNRIDPYMPSVCAALAGGAGYTLYRHLTRAKLRSRRDGTSTDEEVLVGRGPLPENEMLVTGNALAWDPRLVGSQVSARKAELTVDELRRVSEEFYEEFQASLTGQGLAEAQVGYEQSGAYQLTQLDLDQKYLASMYVNSLVQLQNGIRAAKRLKGDASEEPRDTLMYLHAYQDVVGLVSPEDRNAFRDDLEEGSGRMTMALAAWNEVAFVPDVTPTDVVTYLKRYIGYADTVLGVIRERDGLPLISGIRPPMAGKLKAAGVAIALTVGSYYGLMAFSRFKTKPKPRRKPKLRTNNRNPRKLVRGRDRV